MVRMESQAQIMKQKEPRHFLVPGLRQGYSYQWITTDVPIGAQP